MKIKCIDNFGQESVLTIGKIYDASDYEESEFYEFYLLLTPDSKVSGGYLKDRFIEINIKEDRRKKLKKLSQHNESMR